jgi:hypothetical protein
MLTKMQSCLSNFSVTYPQYQWKASLSAISKGRDCFVKHRKTSLRVKANVPTSLEVLWDSGNQKHRSAVLHCISALAELRISLHPVQIAQGLFSLVLVKYVIFSIIYLFCELAAFAKPENREICIGREVKKQRMSAKRRLRSKSACIEHWAVVPLPHFVISGNIVISVHHGFLICKMEIMKMLTS